MSENKRKLISTLRRNFIAENLGAGLYGELARQQRSRAELSAELEAFGLQERMHGRLFSQSIFKLTGARPRGASVFESFGRLLAVFIRPLPLRSRLAWLGRVEAGAVSAIEAELEHEPPHAKLLRRILPDERGHAALYARLYPEN